MAKKLTAKEKIAKTINYCDYSKQKAKDSGYTVLFTIELEYTDGETETEVCIAGSKYSNYFATVELLHYVLKEAVRVAQEESKYFNNLFTARVWIKTFFGGRSIDEEVVNDYEITFARGVEL